MNIGFIGAGNMASAIIRGICCKGLTDPESIYVSNPSMPKLEALKQDCGVNISTDNCIVSEVSDILFLCVKPQKLEEVIGGIKDNIKQDALVVSIAAGKTMASIEDMFGREIKLVRVMPNAPALTGDGMSAVSVGKAAKGDEMLTEVFELLKSVGNAEEVDESVIDIAGQIAGASPAWIAMVIEAMADGAVLEGMPRDMAYRFASAGVAGAGKMAGKLGGNPAAIKDMVSSPKGTTIEGIKILEERGVRSAFMDAVVSSCEKSKKM